jgi:hypothetical protein
MSIKITSKNLLIICLLMLLQTASVFAQNRTCDLRLQVFLKNSSEYPRNSPVKNVSATVVDLNTNEVIKPEIIDGMLYFTGLTQRRYNVVVKKEGYSDSAKSIKIYCHLVDERNAFDETVFMIKDKEIETYITSQSEIDSPILNPPPPPPPPGSGLKYSKEVIERFERIEVLNDRAVYLPKPVFSSEALEYKEELLAGRKFPNVMSFFRIEAQVEVDKVGKVVSAKVDSPFTELIPSVLESAKKAMFLPIQYKGKLSRMRGKIVYEFFRDRP